MMNKNQWPQGNRHPMVYAVSDGVYTKIGYTKNLFNRWNTICAIYQNCIVNAGKSRSMGWESLFLLGYRETVIAEQTERFLHRMFRHRREVGEWFKLNKRETVLLKRFLKSGVMAARNG
jgi:hypothetical protein